MPGKIATAILALTLPGTALAQAVSDPRRPAPAFDTMPPELPAMRGPAVLIFSKTNGYRHDSIAHAVAAVRKLAEARGFSTYATENAAIFNREQLARFDLIVFASATGDMFTPDQRTAFQGWIAAGHGFVGLHGAGDGSHPEWYREMLGYAGYTGHPRGADQFQASDLIVIDRTHPAMHHLPARWRWAEEYYAYKFPPRADAHVLARLDETGMRLEPRHSMGDKHALIWWRCEGRTRIFYSALGHKPETWSDARHLEMIGGAIDWAARREGSGCD
jgi:type 1 glutamine amidotransferase